MWGGDGGCSLKEDCQEVEKVRFAEGPEGVKNTEQTIMPFILLCSAVRWNTVLMGIFFKSVLPNLIAMSSMWLLGP